MVEPTNNKLVKLNLKYDIWDRFFLVAPLVVIGTKEATESYDLAPKHMAMPLGWENYFGFVCTPTHGTYQNILREKEFTVTFPKPEQIVLTSLSATPRCDDYSKPSLQMLPTQKASVVDGVFLAEGYYFLECHLDKIIDDFGKNSLIVGRIVAAYVDREALRQR